MISKKKILEYHYKHTDECGMGCDSDEWHHRCWRCGYVKPLERCHIIPSSLGGPDSPENYVLLCHKCHLEAPNVKDPEYMWKWIEETNAISYDIFWKYRKIGDSIRDKYIKHWGQSKINQSTSAWLAKEILTLVIDECEKECEEAGIPFNRDKPILPSFFYGLDANKRVSAILLGVYEPEIDKNGKKGRKKKV